MTLTHSTCNLLVSRSALSHDSVAVIPLGFAGSFAGNVAFMIPGFLLDAIVRLN